MTEAAVTIPQVIVFYDYACPFCYVDSPRFDRLVREHEAELHLVPFELRPQLSLGETLADLGADHSDRVWDHVRRIAAEEDLPFVLPDFVPNTHLALALGELARDAGPDVHSVTHAAIFRAYQGEGRDISRRDVLLEVADAVGLERAQVVSIWDAGQYDERLSAYRGFAIGMGVRLTPSAIVCNELIIGVRPYPVLEDALMRCFEEPAAEDSGLVSEGGGSLAD